MGPQGYLRGAIELALALAAEVTDAGYVARDYTDKIAGVAVGFINLNRALDKLNAKEGRLGGLNKADEGTRRRLERRVHRMVLNLPGVRNVLVETDWRAPAVKLRLASGRSNSAAQTHWLVPSTH